MLLLRQTYYYGSMQIRTHYHHKYHLSYRTTLARHAYSVLIVIGLLIAGLIVFAPFAAPKNPISISQISLDTLLFASLATFLRLLIAYTAALACSIPLALLITKNSHTEKFLLPIFDIIQSVPVLAFFPIIVIAFISFGALEGAAIFILFFAMLWNIVFSIVGGLKATPKDIQDAATIFKANKIQRLELVTLPAIFPYLMTGSLLAWGQGWSIIIIAEVLHNYIPHSGATSDLFGLGSLIVNSFYSGQNALFAASLVTLILIITILDFFVWQRLLHLAERYKFE